MFVALSFIIAGIVMSFFVLPVGIVMIIIGVIGLIWSILRGAGKGVAWLFGKGNKD